jgi:DNA-directed RNA polymerase I, II, and III subunit RPABC2
MIASTNDNSGKNRFDSFISDDEDDDDNDDEDNDEDYLQKFNAKMKENNIAENHPELIMHNNDEVDALTKIVRDDNGVIIDPLHRTLPFLSKYEKARILGEASRQIDCGRQPYIQIEEGIIDSYVIATKELEMKRLPFIIRRPLPNGSCEYWKLSDLEFINE